MDWNNPEYKELKYLLLDFLLQSQNYFRDKEPFEISLREGMDYVEDFVDKGRMDNGIDSTRKAYDLHGVKYTLYAENNEFNGTPIPEGYEAIYEKCPDGIFPASLRLKRLIEKC